MCSSEDLAVGAIEEERGASGIMEQRMEQTRLIYTRRPCFRERGASRLAASSGKSRWRPLNNALTRYDTRSMCVLRNLDRQRRAIHLKPESWADVRRGFSPVHQQLRAHRIQDLEASSYGTLLLQRRSLRSDDEAVKYSRNACSVLGTSFAPRPMPQGSTNEVNDIIDGRID